MIKLIFLILILLPGLTKSESIAPIRPLLLEEVLDAALRAFPGLMASEQRKHISDGELISAQGGFDTVVKSQNRWSVTGLYENQNYDLVIEQPTSLMGATFFSGWRQGQGIYPIYEGKSLTSQDGEARLGVNIPLWRNREIDKKRASLQQAELGKLIADHEFQQTLLEVRRQASYRYWDWVLAGIRVKTVAELLKVAEQRNEGIQHRAFAGDIPEFEALDNKRAIIERKERLIMAQRMLEQTAIQLSMYWRDEDGQPQMPTTELIPNSFPDLDIKIESNVNEAITTAYINRPDLKRLDLQAQQTQVELQLQENQQNPALDFLVIGAKDIGESNVKLNRNELYLGLNIEIPLQQRVAGGKAKAASANLKRLKWELKATTDRITAEVKDVLSAIQAAKQRITLSKQHVDAAKQLEEGEKVRFDLGETTLLFVNLREIASGDANMQLSESISSLFKSYADYEATLATSFSFVSGDKNE